METELEITSVALGGDGIGRIEGQVAFVPYGLPGDRLRVKIKRQARQVLWADIVEVLEPSPHRIPPACPQFDRCGVCTWIHFGYPAQAEWKRRLVQETLARIGKLEAEVEWREDPQLRTGYRTRAEFHGDGKNFGFYARGTHEIVDMEWCPLCHPRLNDALQKLRAAKPQDSITLTVNPEGDEVFAWTPRPAPGLRAILPVVEWRGETPSQFLFDGVPVLNGAFSQSSLLLNRMLVQCVHEMLPEQGTLLDLYCGSGNFSVPLADRFSVTGLDHHRGAVHAAQARTDADYRPGDERAMIYAIADREWDAILLDPPRTGAKELLPALCSARAKRLVYVSCDPPTLARDLKQLTAGGWALQRTVALDMFPNTAHVETVCLLSRQE